MPTRNEIGLRLSKLRGEKSQQEVADALQVKRETVTQWENATRRIKDVDIVKIADYYNCSCDFILRGVKSQNLDVHKAIGLSDGAIGYLRGLNDLGGISFMGANGDLNQRENLNFINKLLEWEDASASGINYIRVDSEGTVNTTVKYYKKSGIIHAIEDYVKAKNAESKRLYFTPYGQILDEDTYYETCNKTQDTRLFFESKKVRYTSNELACEVMLDRLRGRLDHLASVVSLEEKTEKGQSVTLDDVAELFMTSSSEDEPAEESNGQES